MNGQDEIDQSARRAVRRALDQAADDIDPTSAARLRDARLRAVAAAARRRGRHWQWWQAGVAVAAVVALAVLVVEPMRSPPSTQPLAAAPREAVRDLDLLTSGENLDLLEDLEFFRWLPAERSS